MDSYKNYITTHLNIDESTQSVDDLWDNCETTIKQAAENILGFETSRPRNDWFDEQCQEVTDRKNRAYKKKLQRRTRESEEMYRRMRREEKKVHKKKKRESENRVIEEIEVLRSQNETRKFYQKINKMRKEFKPKVNMCKNKQGDILNDRDDILLRWVEHFSELLGSDENVTPEQFEARNKDQVEDPNIDDIRKAIRRLKNYKAPGQDGMPSELYKQGGDTLEKALLEIILKVWHQQRMPDKWQVGLICPIHKKGDLLECGNYRGITLLNTAYKILSYVIAERIQVYAEPRLGTYQCGFRPGRSTTDQLFILHQILEKTNEFNIDTFHFFIDFKAAYDSILRPKLYEAMNELEIPETLINLTKMTMSRVVCCVKIQNDISNPFETEVGVRQGDALACLLFNIALDKVVREAQLNNRGTIFNKSTQILAYADDVDIITRTIRQAKETFTTFEAAANNMGLHVNEQKTKFMAATKNQRVRDIGQNITINDHNFEGVREFEYLGATITVDNNNSAEIRRRIMLANRCYFGLSKYLRNRNLSRITKIRLYRTLIIPVLMYGSETWTLTKRDESLLMIFERKILRKIYGAIQEDGMWRRRYNFEIYNIYRQAGNKDIVTTIKIGRLRWAGHVNRYDDNNPAKKILKAEPIGTRGRGRPKLRWKDGVSEDARKIGAPNWTMQTRDRNEWRKKLEKVETLL